MSNNEKGPHTSPLTLVSNSRKYGTTSVTKQSSGYLCFLSTSQNTTAISTMNKQHIGSTVSTNFTKLDIMTRTLKQVKKKNSVYRFVCYMA